MLALCIGLVGLQIPGNFVHDYKSKLTQCLYFALVYLTFLYPAVRRVPLRISYARSLRLQYIRQCFVNYRYNHLKLLSAYSDIPLTTTYNSDKSTQTPAVSLRQQISA
jgi:hypothetical protein